VGPETDVVVAVIERHPVVAMWAHPRALSTAFFRMMTERGDFWTVHEPFANLAAQQHFDVAGTRLTTAAQLAAALLARCELAPVFWKDTTEYPHIAVLDSPGMLTAVHHVFLIRDPRAAIPSHYAINPAVTLEEIGYSYQYAMFQRIRDDTGRTPLVIDAADLVADPAAAVRRFCAHVGVPFIASALAWEAGEHRAWERTSHWHRDVSRSNGFHRPGRTYRDSVDNHPTLAAYWHHHRPFYEQMREAATGDRC
jgi:hypothetical protein